MLDGRIVHLAFLDRQQRQGALEALGNQAAHPAIADHDHMVRQIGWREIGLLRRLWSRLCASESGRNHENEGVENDRNDRAGDDEIAARFGEDGEVNAKRRQDKREFPDLRQTC